MAKYFVAPAPGCFGDKTRILSTHDDFDDALAARGSGGRKAIYVADEADEAGDVLYRSTLHPRCDRSPRDMPEPPYYVKRCDDGEHYVFDSRGGSGVPESDIPRTEREAKAYAKLLNDHFTRDWLSTPDE